MSETASTMMPLGSEAPDFSLPDVVSGETISLRDFPNTNALLMMYISRHCPYVQHVVQELARLGKDYRSKNVDIVAISSNDIADYPDDAPDKLKGMAELAGFEFPVCYDATQEVAKSYRAACTPDFFLFNANKELVYRGQLDGSRPGNSTPADGRDLRAAMDALLEGRSVTAEQKPSAGCNIKWKAGNEPDYFG